MFTLIFLPLQSRKFSRLQGQWRTASMPAYITIPPLILISSDLTYGVQDGDAETSNSRWSCEPSGGRACSITYTYTDPLALVGLKIGKCSRSGCCADGRATRR